MIDTLIQNLNSPIIKNLLELYPGIMGIFNYNSFKYEFFSPNVEKILGYSAEEYIEGGLAFSYSTLNNIHASIITSEIYPVYLEYCVKHSPNEGIKRLRFSYEYQVNAKYGASIWCQHQFTIIEVDAKGFPILDLFCITDINDSKKDDVINFVISQKNDNEIYETIFTNGYQTRDLTVLSNRELQVLKLLCEGNSTPKIAAILNLSEHTVKSHRKNILLKMEVKNSMDIVKIAHDNGFI